MDTRRTKKPANCQLTRRETTKPRLDYSEEDLEEIVHRNFSKKFSFSYRRDWRLSKDVTLFTTNRFSIPELQKYKDELNGVKNKLNDLVLNDWHKHTGYMNHAGEVILTLKKMFKPELLTQAWCKFYEILSTYQVIPKMCIFSEKLNSIHLCEAPGAFIASLNHYLLSNYPYIQWKWCGNTLNPYYEGNSTDQMINDDRFILNTFENWTFGADLTGDLFDKKNFEAILIKAEEMGPVYLVTADGSVNCQNDPGEQENIVSSLFHCETITALNILHQGGSFVLKVFTMFECETICLMYLLCCFFESVNVFKPVTSKEGNSECYVVCLGFIGKDNISKWLIALNDNYGQAITKFCILERTCIPDDFITQITQCSNKFKESQVSVIERNLRTYKNGLLRDEEKTNDIRKAISKAYIERYKLETIPLNKFITRNDIKYNYDHIPQRDEVGTFNDRQHLLGQRGSRTYYEHLKNYLESLEYHNFDIGKVTIQSTKELLAGTYIQKGKRLKEISSSRFCISKLIDIKKELDPYVEDYSSLLPQVTVGDSNRKIVSEECNLADCIRMKDMHQIHVEIVTRIQEFLNNLDKGESLYITEYFSLLTQFNVGLLYVLGSYFESVEFYNPSKYGIKLLLNNYSGDVTLREFLNKVIAQMNKCEENQSVLTLLPINKLCTAGPFCEYVNATNSILLKETSIKILNKYVLK